MYAVRINGTDEFTTRDLQMARGYYETKRAKAQAESSGEVVQFVKTDTRTEIL